MSSLSRKGPRSHIDVERAFSQTGKKGFAMRALCILGVTFAVALFTGCDDDDDNDTPDVNDGGTGGVGGSAGEGGAGAGGEGGSDVFELEGHYVDEWNVYHDITRTLWKQWSDETPDYNSDFVIEAIRDHYVIAKNAEGNPYNPGLYSRFDWTQSAGAFWFCQIAYNLENAAQADTLDAPDADDPATSGCNGFSWSKLIPIE